MIYSSCNCPDFSDSIHRNMDLLVKLSKQLTSTHVSHNLAQMDLFSTLVLLWAKLMLLAGSKP